MPEVFGVEKLLSAIPHKRFGRFNQYGTSQFGYSRYGEEDIILFPDRYDPLGQNRFPKLAPINFSGIYRTFGVLGHVKTYKEPYYITKNPRSVPQQANRSKMTSAVLAYQALTASEKMLYHKRAVGKRMSGYNLFLKEHLLSH